MPAIIEYPTIGKDAISSLNASASRDGAGALNVSVCNLDPSAGRTLRIEVRGTAALAASGRVLTGGSVTGHNTFDDPTRVVPRAIEGVTLRNGAPSVEVPAHSVAVIAVS